ncbi:hypothetical protein ACPSL3_09875 [Vibrio owensii]|uniref:hypothetical protein n=1 Tax=Vibrio owensii TaxID=696485 RepID=UPI003CE451BF|nr:hypothetical protein [Vibrio harveyi]
MGYNFQVWANRYAERSDLSTKLVHLTKETEQYSELEIIYKILSDGIIKGSGNDGFVIGSTPAACFQDAPLYAICQNCWYEEKYNKDKPEAKVRYSPIGFLVEKTDVYNQGGRPVIYDKTKDAKRYLPPEQHWRIVNLDLDDYDKIIDWTHEREWRVPNKFKLDLSTTVLLFTNDGDIRNFIEHCDSNDNDVYKKVAGFVTLSSLLY